MNSNGAKSFLVLCVCRVVLQSIDCLCHTAIQRLELMKLNVDCTSIKLGCSICVCVMFALDIASCQCNGLPFLWISLFISEVSDERWLTLTPFIEQIKCCDDKKKLACIWAENDVRGYSGSGTTSVFSSSSFPSSILQPVFVLPRHTHSLSLPFPMMLIHPVFVRALHCIEWHSIRLNKDERTIFRDVFDGSR